MAINAAFVERLAKRRAENLMIMERDSDVLLDKALRNTERKVIAAASDLPTKQGVLFDARAAIAIRPRLMDAINREFLGFAHKNVDGYSKAAKVITENFGKLGYDGSFTDIDRETIRQLKKIAFSGFEDIARANLDKIATEVYTASLSGAKFQDLAISIGKTVQGTHVRGFDPAADELVSFIEKYRNNPSYDERVAKAAEELHVIHSKDIVGQSLRKYATQMAHDSLMQFDASYNKAKAKEVGIKHFQYTGTSIKDTRDWCEEHIDRVMTEEEIRDEWGSNNWKGKSDGDPFIVRGGYNCRHHWQPVDPSWFE